MRNKAGFTLVEIMVSLVLVGLIASIAGTSVLMGLQGYVTTRENNKIAQKAQLALNRINREFIELSDVLDADPACIVYESPYGRRAVKMVEVNGVKTIHLFTSSVADSCDSLASGDVLVDGVQSLSILYNPSGGMSLWAPDLSNPNNIKNLYALNVLMVMRRPDTGSDVPFSMTVNPRNNGNAGGSIVPSPDSKPPEYATKTCFVATAAWGDEHHPVVELLRDFRDRVLMKTEPGKTVIRFYYREGPTLAAAIEGSPVACLAARIMITPLAGFALLALTWPVLIPVVLLLSWVLARLAVRAPGRKSSRWSARLQGERGAILVTLIAALVVFSALSAVMIGMFGTTSLGQALGSNMMMRAYYLAESGFRYAASNYINAADESARESRMSAMHDQEYTLSGKDEKFKLGVYPYYFKSIQPPSDDELTTQVFGGLPVKEEDLNKDSWFKVQRPDGVITYNRISGVGILAPNTVIFRQIDAVGKKLSWDSDYGVGSVITPVCIPDRNSLRLIDNNDGSYDLAFVSGTGARVFPERNGVFAVKFEGESSPRLLSYRLRNLNRSRFEGIRDTGGRNLPTVPMVDPGTGAPYKNFIELVKFVRLESTGTLGSGAATVSRKVTYEIPIGYMTAAAPKTEAKEQFGSSLANWFTGSEVSHIGTQAIEGGALRLTGAATTNVMPGSSCLLFRENQIALDWRKAFASSGAQENFETEWRRAGKYLSYDVQAKLRLGSTNTIYSGGLSFRLDEQGNSLGLSIVRASPGLSAGCDVDGIPDNLTTAFDLTSSAPFTELTHSAYLVLWTKETAKTERNFVTVPSPHLDPAPPPGTGTRAIRSGDCSYWRSGARVRFVNTGGSLPGGISAGTDYFIRVIFKDSVRYVYLFDTYERAVGLGESPWAGLQDITSEGSGTNNMVAQDPQWLLLAYRSLTSNVGDVLDILSSSGAGLYERFRDWITLKVRVIEAPSLSFINGGGAGLEIVSGDVLYQTQDNTAGGTVEAIAMARNDPVYWNLYSNQPAEWNWEAKTAAGVVLLEPLRDDMGSIRPYQFTGGKRLFRGNPPTGMSIATIGIPEPFSAESAAFRLRDNWAQVFVGDQDLPNNPNDDPLDTYRALSPRDSVFWAPDRVGYPGITTPSNDRFTLVRMADDNAYRNPCYLRRFLSKQNRGNYRGDFIRIGRVQYDGQPFFASPVSGDAFPSSRPEIGLHAYGPADSITNFYFDDFAVRFGPIGGVRPRFLIPVQH